MHRGGSQTRSVESSIQLPLRLGRATTLHAGSSDRRRVWGLFLERIRILCGTRDGFYLNEAVARLKAKVEGWRARTPDVARALRRRGYIELVDGLDHDTLVPLARLRFHREIAAHLAEAGHTD